MTSARLFPQPMVSVVLFAVWLLAANRFTVGLALLGLGFAALIPWYTSRFWPDAPQRLRVRPLAALMALLLYDIVVANLRVAVLILGPRSRLRPAFFVVPLDVRGPFTITLLASIVSLTPGTVSAAVAQDRRTLLVHGLDVPDIPHAVRQIKHRYERRLQEVFE